MSQEMPVITTQGLTKYFGDKCVVDAVTMAVPKGCVFAFLGRNGSGKTTTIRMLLGLLAPTRGGSTVLGCDSRRLGPGERARIGYASESHALYDWMSVGQMHAYQRQFYGHWNEELFKQIADHFRLETRSRVGSLSRGERAGLSLAVTLAPEPEVLILDDPALGLDPVARRSLLESIVFATRRAGRTIFFSSHLLDDVERVAEYVAVLDRSVLRACCPVETIRSHIRQFVLRYDDRAKVPTQVPAIRGLLNTRRTDGELRLTIVAAGNAEQQVLGGLGAQSIEELPVGFEDALVGYLGDRGVQGFSFGGSSPATQVEAAP